MPIVLLITTVGLFAGAEVNVDLNLVAITGLLITGVGAYTSAKLLSSNRRKIVAEASDSATTALERALERYEKEVRRCDERIDELEGDLAEALRNLGTTAAERDELRETADKLAERVEHLEERLRRAGIPNGD